MSITLKQALAIMESGEVFSIEYVTCDHQKKQGGKKISFKEAKLLQRKKNKPTTSPGIEKTTDSRIKTLKSKSPNHKTWFTRNIRILQSGKETGMIKKIHPPLIIKFNGKELTL